MFKDFLKKSLVLNQKQQKQSGEEREAWAVGVSVGNHEKSFVLNQSMFRAATPPEQKQSGREKRDGGRLKP